MSNDEKPADYRQAAEDNLLLAKALVGQVQISDQEILDAWPAATTAWTMTARRAASATRSFSGARIARDLIAAGEWENVMGKWSAENERLWRESKFFRLYQEEVAAGRDRKRRSRPAVGRCDAAVTGLRCGARSAGRPGRARP